MNPLIKIPFFSVIIPLYNKEEYIENTIKSVLNQTFQYFEIIIVDDGSTDNSFQLVSNIKDPRINLIQQENKGVSVARNTGINQSKSEYITLLDADDLWKREHLHELKRLIEIFPKAGLFCNNYQIRRYKKNIFPASFNFNYSKSCMIVNDFFNANLFDCIPSSSSTGFLKSTFDKIKRYNTHIPSGQDTDLWIKFALHYDIAFNPKITMTYNNYDYTSLSKSKYNVERYTFINSYSNEEKTNKSLKKYLDINRYAVAIRCKLNNEYELHRKLKGEIDYKNLNFKQKILLKFPKFLLKFIKKIQHFLIDKKIYLTSYS